MRKLVLALALIGLLGAEAQAQVVAPSVETFMGPSIGKQWQPSNSLIFGINSQVGTTYTILATDIGKLVAFNNGSAIAITLPQAGTPGFEANKQFCLTVIGAGTATVTPTTSTINGGANKAYAQGVRACIVSDGTNYWSY
jgi:hypothetical protein